MQIPTYVCATDIVEGKSKAWARGEIAPRVMASCSVPIVFPPVEIDGHQYIDGGVLRNLPAWAIRNKCRSLLGSNCSPLADNYIYKDSLPSLTMRTYALMSKSNVLQDILLCDYMVRHAAVASIPTFNMSEMNRIVLAGYEAASPVIESILNSRNSLWPRNL